jgi:hypothetical protein
LGIIIANHYPIGTINATIKKLCEQLRIIHEDSATYRDEALTRNANFAEDTDEPTKAKHIRQQKNAERKNRAWSKL